MNSNLSLLLLSINPILSSIREIKLMLVNGKVNPVIFGISFALVLSYFPMFYDSVNNFIITQDIADGRQLGMRLYNYIPYKLSNIGINFISYYFVTTSFILSAYFFFYNYIIKEGYYRNLRTRTLIVSLVFILTLNYRELLDLHRFYLAAVILLLANYYFFRIQKFNFFSYLGISSLTIISVFVHEAVSILVLAIFAAYFIKRIEWYLILFILCFLGGVVYEDFALSLVRSFVEIPGLQSLFGDELYSKMIFYVTSQSHGFGVEVEGIGYRVTRPISVLVLSCYFYIGYKCCVRNSSWEIRSVLLAICLSLLFYGTLTIYERFYLLSALFSLVLFRSWPGLKVGIALVFLLLSINLVSSAQHSKVFTNKYNYVLSDQEEKISIFSRIFYFPTPLLLMFDEFGQSDKYLSRTGYR